MGSKRNVQIMGLILAMTLFIGILAPVGRSEASDDISGAFTDANFKKAVWQWLGNMGEPSSFSQQDLKNRMEYQGYTLNVSSKSITSLAGLQYFNDTGLKKFMCSNNQLSSLPALPASLTELSCDNNTLTSLPSTLPSGLITTDCSYNTLVSLPALPASIKYLACANNKLSSLPTLPLSLEELYCFNNALLTLPALPGKLVQLNCCYNNLTTLPSLPSSLTKLNCSYNQIASLPTLPASLLSLEVASNKIKNLPSSLPASLNVLDCNYNYLSGLPDLPAGLTWILHCERNFINVYSGSVKEKIDACLASSKSYKTQLRYAYPGESINLNSGDSKQIAQSDLMKQMTINGSAWTPLSSEFLNKFTFSSTDEKVATVNATGLIQAKSDGSCNILAKFQGIDSLYTTVSIPINVSGESTMPAEPTGLKATPGDGQIIISWNANTESDIVGYNVAYMPEGGSWSTRYVNTNAFTITGLINGTVYTLKVNAVNSSNQTSEFSDTVRSTPQSGAALSTISISSPGSGETWISEEKKDIKWTYTGKLKKVDIQLLKGGELYKGITSTTANKKKFSWMIPADIEKGTYQIKIVSSTNDKVYDISDDFTISPPLTSITLTSPDGAVNWEPGSSQTLKWSYEGKINKADIQLLKNGDIYKTIASTSAKKKSYKWKVPEDLDGIYQIRIINAANAAVYDTSEDIGIAAPEVSLNLSSPDENSVWKLKKKQTIKWTYTGSPGKVKVSLYKGDALIREIGSIACKKGKTSGSCKFTPPVSLVPGDDYNIIISTVNQPDVIDESGLFTIVGCGE